RRAQELNEPQRLEHLDPRDGPRLEIRPREQERGRAAQQRLDEGALATLGEIADLELARRIVEPGLRRLRWRAEEERRRVRPMNAVQLEARPHRAQRETTTRKAHGWVRTRGSRTAHDAPCSPQLRTAWSASSTRPARTASRTVASSPRETGEKRSDSRVQPLSVGIACRTDGRWSTTPDSSNWHSG